MSSPFVMSIEIAEGRSAVHGYHLGTDERLARSIVEERFHGRVKFGLPTVTIALMRDRKVVDVFDGSRWSSELVEEAFSDELPSFKLPISNSDFR